MGLLFKDICILVFQKVGFGGQELKGNFILRVAPKTEFLMVFL